jgi:hypothetical protein
MAHRDGRRRGHDMTIRLLITGAGFSGLAIGRAVAASSDWAGGTTRDHRRFPELVEAGLRPYLFDGAVVGADLRDAMRRTTHLVQSIAPDRDGDPLLRAIGGDLRGSFPELRWVGYLSTVGVYGDHQGEWVDETTPCRPVSQRSVQRLAAEHAWQHAGQAAGFAVAVLRLSGIYGPGRNAFVNLERRTARRLVKPGQVFNRIHVLDIAGATAWLMNLGASGIYNVTDDMPAPPQDLVTHAAALMGVLNFRRWHAVSTEKTSV